MWAFVIRRILIGLGVLLLASFIMYGMVNWVIDPLDDLYQSTDPDKELRIAERIAALELDKPWVSRYWDWLTAFVQGDLGTAWQTNRSVLSMTRSAIISTLQLVSAATVLSIVLGVAVGIASALRQYTSFDYIITFFYFLLYSLTSYLVVVLFIQWPAHTFIILISTQLIPITLSSLVRFVFM